MYIGKIETGRSYKKIIIIFALISIILIGFVIYNSLSKAKIVLTPKKEIEKVEFEIIVGNPEENKSLPSSTLKGKLLVKENEAKQKYSDLIEKTVQSHAEGKVIVYNKRQEAQALIPKTQLRSEKTNQIFRTTGYAAVPGNGQVEVGVIADEIGEKTNIEPDKFIVVKIWKDWQSLIYAESKEPMKGGIKQGKVATQEEIDKAKNQVAQNIHQNNLESFKKDLAGGEKISDKASKYEILKDKAFVKVDEQVSDFDMYVQIKSITLTFNEEELFKEAQKKLEEKILENKEFLGYDQNSFQYEISYYNEKEKYAKIKTSLSGNSVYKIASTAFDKEKLIGRTREETEQYFKKDGDIEKVEVSFFPFWVNSVPNMKDHIEIIVQK